MKLECLQSYMTLLLLSSAAFAQAVTPPTTLPEPPAIWREVTGAVYTDPLTTIVANKLPVHTDAHVPAFRTSRDGRIGLRVLPNVDFTLLMPEKLTTHVRLAKQPQNANNSYVMSKQGYVYLEGTTVNTSAVSFVKVPAGMTGGAAHYTLYDPTPANPTSGEDTNPKDFMNPQTGLHEDQYDLKVLTCFRYDNVVGNGANQDKIQFFVTPIQVFVSNPKTTSASIRVIKRDGVTVGGPALASVTTAAPFEISVAGDGRLVVLRLAGSVLAWKDENGVQRAPAEYDIVYSYYTGGNPCDPTRWTSLMPISHAPFDSRINTKFGFAMSQFRDASGNLIADGTDIGGTYPWIDREAKNLFFTAVNDTLRYRTGTGAGTVYTSSRYVQRPTPGEQVDNAAEENSGTRGICVAGLWTQGKVVMIDNLNNDMDYAMNSGGNLYTRQVKLFESGAAIGAAPDWLKMGGGRVNSSPDMPPGDNRNSTIIDSLENIFNYRKNANPITVGDVVWPLHNGKHSDDLVFDNYVDPDAFIVANMSGLVTLTPGGTFATLQSGSTTYTNVPQRYSYTQNSGWSSTTNSFSNTVLLQNAATTMSNRWVVPTHGVASGQGGRLEPAATGGIHGKGYWMNGANGLAFNVGVQPQNVTTKDWYVGLFVDCRFDDDSTSRELLAFPDNSSICLNGRHELEYFDASGSSVQRIPLPEVNASKFPDMLPKKGWAHLAWQIRKEGTKNVIEFLLNGLVYHAFNPSTPLFQMAPAGLMNIGKDSRFPNEPGFKGWIDDFIVLAHGVDPETACNHAGGTLVGLRASYTGDLLDFAARFPAATHTAISNRLLNNGETAWPKYANYYNYTQDNGVQLSKIGATGDPLQNTVSLRASIHFPEGPLFFNRPRPDSTKNSFCITCHSDQGKGGLDLMALMLDPLKTASQDDRRQPSQPFRRLFGNIPLGLVDNANRTNNQPTAEAHLLSDGKNIDEWMLASFANVVTVKTFTLVDAVNNVDLATLKNNDVVKRSDYGATSYAIRANVDYAQGSVTLTFDGGTSVTPVRIPYSVTPPSFAPGPHTITATPQLGGVAVTITFTVQ